MTCWRYSLVGCVNPPTQTKYPSAIKTSAVLDNPQWTWIMMRWILGQEDVFYTSSSWERHFFFTCTEEERLRKGLHSWCSGCVVVDMAWLYKILRLVSSQRPVSKHAASVWLQACLSLRPRSARITQSKAPPFNRRRKDSVLHSSEIFEHEQLLLLSTLDSGFKTEESDLNWFLAFYNKTWTHSYNPEKNI